MMITDQIRGKYRNIIMKPKDGAKIDIAIQALEDICFPMAALERELKEGERLNGFAVQVANDPSFLRHIAMKALKKIKEGLG